MKLTISPKPTTTHRPAGIVKLKAFQIAVPVRLSIQGLLSPEFPAVLDTGLSHNFSMKEEHLQQWLQLPAKKVGVAFINGYPVPTVHADLVIEGRMLALREGMAVYPPQNPFAPRLPTLGLRALVRNKVRLVIDGYDVTIG